jgi:hypothetical protein
MGGQMSKIRPFYIFAYSLQVVPFLISLTEFSTVTNSSNLRMDATGF